MLARNMGVISRFAGAFYLTSCRIRAFESLRDKPLYRSRSARLDHRRPKALQSNTSGRMLSIAGLARATVAQQMHCICLMSPHEM